MHFFQISKSIATSPFSLFGMELLFAENPEYERSLPDHRACVEWRDAYRSEGASPNFHLRPSIGCKSNQRFRRTYDLTLVYKLTKRIFQPQVAECKQGSISSEYLQLFGPRLKSPHMRWKNQHATDALGIDAISATIRKYRENGKSVFASSSFQTHSIPLLHMLSRNRCGHSNRIYQYGFSVS